MSAEQRRKTRRKTLFLDDLLPEARHSQFDASELKGLNVTNAFVDLLEGFITVDLIHKYILSLYYDYKWRDRTVYNVWRENKATCFDGSLYSNMALYLHGYSPRTIMLLGNQKCCHHNIVAYRDKQTNLIGSLAMSSWDEFFGKPAEYLTVRELAESYEIDYPGMVGFTEPIDVIGKYGIRSFFDESMIKTIYDTYTHESLGYATRKNQRRLPHSFEIPKDDGPIVINGKVI